MLVVDEIASTGETLVFVRQEALSLGAREVRCAVLYAHTWGADVPDYVGLISDELLLNPWDREIFADGTFVMNPEYVGALRQQGLDARSSTAHRRARSEDRERRVSHANRVSRLPRRAFNHHVRV